MPTAHSRFALVTTAFLSALIAAQLRAQSCVDLVLDDDSTVRMAHVNVIKRAILFKLQMTQEPENPRVPIDVPLALEEEYRAVSAAQKLVSEQRPSCAEQPEVPLQLVLLHPIEVLRRAGHHGTYGDFPLSSSQALQSSIHLLRFDFNLSDYAISSVELRLWYHVLNKESVRPQDKQWIMVSNIFKDNPQYNGYIPAIFCARAVVSLEKDGYVSFNISRVVEQLIAGDVTTGRLYLEVEVEKIDDVHPTAVEIAYTDIKGRYSKTTQLVLGVNSRDDKRRKRQVGGRVDPSCTAAASRNCCKQNLVLDIHRDLNWYWVLRPRTLPINFCSGFCSLNWPTATYHTLLSLVYSAQQDNPTGSPTPCCVPNKFASLPFLIFNGTTIELISIDDITIESCICR